MTKNRLKNAYFKWICGRVCGRYRTKTRPYQKLLRCLDGMEFTYVIPMDGNRAEDGVDLRYRFAYENGYENAMAAEYLDDRPCSVLEMMAALAIRCEEHIMDDPDIGDRTGQWFWDMCDSLGVGDMDDARFDEGRARDIIRRFLDRRYKRDGQGGLFTVKGTGQDMRSVEIWYQMCGYLNHILNTQKGG